MHSRLGGSGSTNQRTLQSFAAMVRIRAARAVQGRRWSRALHRLQRRRAVQRAVTRRASSLQPCSANTLR